MDKIKKIIIILIVLVLMAIMCIIALKGISSEDNNNKQYIEEHPSDTSGSYVKQLGLVENHATLFSVESMLYNYMMKIEYSSKQATYNLTDAEYIAKNNITVENILNHVSDIAPYSTTIRIREIYERVNVENTVYYIKCILEKDNVGKETYFILYVDETNNTYSIERINAEIYASEIVKVNEENAKKVIEKNNNNKTAFVNPTEEEIATKYFEDFIANALYYPEYAYDLLDTEYKEKCFPSLQEFKDYIESKRDILETYDVNNLKQLEDFNTMEEYTQYLYNVKKLELEKYQIRNTDEYDRYMCLDNLKNYYTFYVTSPLKYSVVLGNYAIPTENFVEGYNRSSQIEKVILNIKRFFMGIDDKNYGYSYSVLSQAFKNNKYPNKESFVDYAKQNFFEKNEVEYVDYSEENGVFIYKINLKDATGASIETKAFNMIVKLNNGTDFEMSFGTN